MSFQMSQKKIKKLSLYWLGLVAFNVFLSFSSVESFFERAGGHIAQSDVCQSGQYYTHRSDKERVFLFAFFGGTAFAQNSSDHKFLTAQIFNIYKIFLIDKNNKFAKAFIAFNKSFEGPPRAPPQA